MSDIVPSDLLYGQALELVREIRESQDSNDTLELIKQLNAVASRFDEVVGHPISMHEPIVSTEPPSTEKTNRFLRGVEADINLLQRQLDLLRSASIFTHNAASTELASLKDNNAKIGNQVKSLQLYSGSRNSNIVTFTDTFRNRDMLDDSFVPPDDRVTLPSPGYITLPPEGESINLSADAEIKILDSSNGFLGNNQEIEDPETAPIDQASGARQYAFVQESYEANELSSLVDEEPDTWIEYEHYMLTDEQRAVGRNYNFVYTADEEDGSVREIEWSNGPADGVLKLALEFDLKSVRQINSVSLIPFGLEDNKNYPILIKSISTSGNGTDWYDLRPTEVWVANDINLQNARSASSAVVGGAVWNFPARHARYVRVKIEQRSAVDANIGHIYWVNKDSESSRVEGPNPPIDDTGKFLSTQSVGDALQRRQFFQGKRWVIGVRDVNLVQTQYSRRASMVTKPMRVAGRIERVALESVELEVPESYPIDEHWVRFFVSPDDGESWYPIARISDPETGLPQQISFNDPLHESLREASVMNYITENSVTTLRLKVELERPDDAESTTPILRSYTLKVLKQ